MDSRRGNLTACHNKCLMASNLVRLMVYPTTGSSLLYRFSNSSSNIRIPYHNLALPDGVLAMSRTLLLYHRRIRAIWLT